MIQKIDDLFKEKHPYSLVYITKQGLIEIRRHQQNLIEFKDEKDSRYYFTENTINNYSQFVFEFGYKR